jgi:ABC-type enterochelin transport system permease subunit
MDSYIDSVIGTLVISSYAHFSGLATKKDTLSSTNYIQAYAFLWTYCVIKMVFTFFAHTNVIVPFICGEYILKHSMNA